MGRIVVVGGTLPGIAAAARLSRVGHDVTLVERRDHLGGRLAQPGVLPSVLAFPAPLRDLFRKSGRPFDAEFGRRGLQLAPAPPAVHMFPDGAELTWPTDRGDQWHELERRYGPGVATHWRDVVDDYAETWQILRHLGLERELALQAQVTARRSQLNPRLSIEGLARHLGHPHLAELVREVAWRIGSLPNETPAWLASRLSVARTFGRWMVVDETGQPQSARVVLDVLADRLGTRGVRTLLETEVTSITPVGVASEAGHLSADAVISCLNPWEHVRLLSVRDPALRRAVARTTPANAPLISVRNIPERREPAEHIRHTANGPVVTYLRPVPTGTEVIVHDHTQARPDPGAGVRWRGWRTWVRMPALRRPSHPTLLMASASSRGGNEPWAQLLSGALATYAAHELITGEDIRPTNREYRP